MLVVVCAIFYYSTVHGFIMRPQVPSVLDKTLEGSTPRSRPLYFPLSLMKIWNKNERGIVCPEEISAPFSGQCPPGSHFPKLHRAGTQCAPSEGQG